MFDLLNTLLITALINVNPVAEPAASKTLSFGTSAYVTVNNEIRLSVDKSTAQPVMVQLRNAKKEVLFQEVVRRKTDKYSVKLNMSEVGEGQYELEVRSKEGSIVKQVKVGAPSVQDARFVVMK